MKEYIDFDKTEGRNQITVKVSKIALNLDVASSESIDFLEMMEDTLDEAFETPFVNFIDYKWKNEKRPQYYIAAMHALFVINLNAYTINLKIAAVSYSEEWLIVIMILVSLMIAFEII